ncbi:MFS transporter, partial [Pseudomonas aeruginosa]|nr:MFS transporter [Pseudomonas aeruginosa]
MNRDLRRALDDEPMRPFQWLAVAVCIVLNLIDGFDVLVMAFTASSVAAEWNLGGAEIGLLLSAGLFGMAAGSLFIAPWADRWGRRPLILACLARSGLGMLASALSQAAWQLALLRGLTGLGIGGILASSNVIASEYASRRWRGLAVSLQSTGYALGAGCALPLLCAPLVARDNARVGLPEITLGIRPGAGGTQRLIRSVGKALASRMVLSGESIDARQAQQAGLVSDIHPAALTDEYALQLATTIARHSPLALRAAKQSLRLS